MRTAICLAVLILSSFGTSPAAAADAKADADPLAAFTDEQLIEPGFCFQKFAEAVGAKNAVLAKAFLAETPKALEGLDLKKEADRAKFLAVFSRFANATPIKSQRFAIAGQAEVTYSDAQGTERTVRMQNMGGRWKIVPD